MKGRINTVITIEQQYIDKLHEIAQQEERSIAFVIRKIIEGYFKRRNENESIPSESTQISLEDC